jgi:hypothetical protein
VDASSTLFTVHCLDVECNDGRAHYNSYAFTLADVFLNKESLFTMRIKILINVSQSAVLNSDVSLPDV